MDPGFGPRVLGWLSLLLLTVMARSGGATDVPGLPGRWSVSGHAEGDAVFRTDRDTQRQRPAGAIDLKITGDVHPKLRLFVETRALFGGPPERPDGVGLYNLEDAFQNISPSVEITEAYADLYLPRLDVRIGK